MTVPRKLLLIAAAFVSMNASAQLNIPVIIQLPSDDFVWNWGRQTQMENAQRPEFTILGRENQFECTLTGAFRPGSEYSEFRVLRNFEHQLATSFYFIQEATYNLNELYRSNQLQWAMLNCIIPETETTDEVQAEQLQRAIERAERQRERRRAREERDND